MGRGHAHMTVTRDALDGAVLWTLIRASVQVKRTLGALFSEHDLSAVQFGVLANLSAEPQLTTAELARHTLTRPQSLAGVLDNLTERGLIQRSTQRRQGVRNTMIVTEAGEELLARVWPKFLAANDLSAHGVDMGKQGDLNAVLHALFIS